MNTEDVGNCCIRVYIYLQKKTLVLILKLLSVILSKLSIYSVKLRIPNNLLFLLYNFCFLKQNINTPLSCKILLKLVIKPWLPTHSPRAFFCPLSLLKMPYKCFMNLHLSDQNYLQINMIVFNGEKLVFQVKNALQSFSCSFFCPSAEKVGHPCYKAVINTLFFSQTQHILFYYRQNGHSKYDQIRK